MNKMYTEEMLNKFAIVAFNAYMYAHGEIDPRSQKNEDLDSDEIIDVLDDDEEDEDLI